MTFAAYSIPPLTTVDFVNCVCVCEKSAGARKNLLKKWRKKLFSFTCIKAVISIRRLDRDDGTISNILFAEQFYRFSHFLYVCVCQSVYAMEHAYYYKNGKILKKKMQITQ